MSANIATEPCKITVLYGSPRAGGYTKPLLDSFLVPFEGRADIRIFDAFEQRTLPCIDCKVCSSGAPCPFNAQDGYGGVLERLMTSDIVVLATPVYFSSVPGPMKMMIDRMQQNYIKRFVLKQPLRDSRSRGVILAVGGMHKEELGDALFLTFKQFFDCTYSSCEGFVLMQGTDDGLNEGDLMNARLLAKSMMME